MEFLKFVNFNDKSGHLSFIQVSDSKLACQDADPTHVTVVVFMILLARQLRQD